MDENKYRTGGRIEIEGITIDCSKTLGGDPVCSFSEGPLHKIIFKGEDKVRIEPSTKDTGDIVIENFRE